MLEAGKAEWSQCMVSTKVLALLMEERDCLVWNINKESGYFALLGILSVSTHRGE